MAPPDGSGGAVVLLLRMVGRRTSDENSGAPSHLALQVASETGRLPPRMSGIRVSPMTW